MQNTTSPNGTEQRVFSVETKNYKSMMLAPDGMSLMSKTAAGAAEFQEIFEKGGMLNTRVKIDPDKFKNFVFQKGGKSMDIGYKKLLELGVPGNLEFQSEADLEEVLTYIEKKWMFRRSEQQLSPLKATVPYFGGLLLTLFCTGFIIYVNLFGGTYRVNILFILLIKLSEKIGFTATLLMGLAICALVIRALWKAYQNPPVEVRLEP